MSVTTPESPTCTHCGGTDDNYDVPLGYCSRVCYYRDKGEAILRRVESQSQFCSTCYGQVRDIEPAGARAPACADGWQYPTPLTTIGIDVFNDRPRIEGTRISCGGCGAVNPDDGPIAELQQIHGTDAKVNLFMALAWLADREAIDAAPDLERYGEALRERPYDAAYAVGRAVYGGEA